MSFVSPHVPGSQLWCEGLSKHISGLVDDDTQAELDEGSHRWHLGASEIGKPCSRAIWYSFRWVLDKKHPAHMLRLFRRGHDEEARFVNRLRRIGIEVWEVDENGKQFRIRHPDNAHYGGSLDAHCRIAWLPDAYNRMLGEFKTHNEKSFDKLKTKGVRLAKPQHYAQMCTYGAKQGYSLGLYCAVCKNDDRLHWEVVPLDHKEAEMLDRKALHVIASQEPPRRYSENSADIECKFCDFRGVCHLRQPLAVNCRSCLNCSATPDGEWRCRLYGNGQPIPRELVATGCQSWTPIS